MRHINTHRNGAVLTTFSLALTVLLALIVALPAIAQDRAGQKTLPVPSIAPGTYVGKMPGQINKARIKADVEEYFVRNNIKVTMVPATQQTVEQYRADMLDILEALKGTLIGYNLPGADRMDAAIAALQAATEEDLMKLKNVADLSLLKSLIVQQSQVIQRSIEFRKREEAARQQNLIKNAVAAGLYPGPFPQPIYSQLCPLNPQADEVVFAADMVLNAAGYVRNLALLACEQLIFGFNGASVCIVSETIYFAAAFAHFFVEYCAENTDSGRLGAGLNRLEYIKDQLEFSIENDNANRVMLSSQLANVDVHLATVANNNTGTLSSQADAAKALTTRIAIELNLASNLTTDAAVSLYQLPASQGGYLEVVRQTLIDTYNAQVAAAGVGVTVYNPLTELSLGATYTSQGKYREAYYQYRKGYRSVVKYP